MKIYDRFWVENHKSHFFGEKNEPEGHRSTLLLGMGQESMLGMGQESMLGMAHESMLGVSPACK